MKDGYIDGCSNGGHPLVGWKSREGREKERVKCFFGRRTTPVDGDDGFLLLRTFSSR